jgi:hypothetical protein
MRQYRVYVNGIEQNVQGARVSALPLNQCWDGTQRPIEQSEEAYFVSFDIVERSTLIVEINEDFERYELRPLSRDFEEYRDGQRIILTVERPMQFSLEIDGTHHALHVFVNPVAE